MWQTNPKVTPNGLDLLVFMPSCNPLPLHADRTVTSFQPREYGKGTDITPTIKARYRRLCVSPLGARIVLAGLMK